MFNWLKYFFVIGFSIVLYIVPVFTFFDFKTMDDDTFEKMESRKKVELQPWDYSSKKMKEYFTTIERFINDRFAFRNDLLTLHAEISIFLGQSPIPDRVLLGKQNWLFLNNDYQQLIKQHQGKYVMTTNEIRLWQKYFIKIQNYLQQQNIEFILVIAPEKHTVYSEFLPVFAAKKGETPYDQIRKEVEGLNLIDLHQPLLNKKKQTDMLLYHKTDTHWNSYGAYLGYLTISSAIKYNSYKPLEIPDSNFKMEECLYKTDIQTLIRLPEKFSDNIVQYKGSIFNKDSIMQCTDLSLKKCKYLKKKQMINIREEPLVVNTWKTARAICIGDSFFHEMSPFFNSSFGMIQYKFNISHGRENLYNVITEYKPDIVIWEMAERLLKSPLNDFFTWKNPEELIPLYIFSLDSVWQFSKLNKFVETVDNEDNGLSYSSTGNDPIIIFPQINYPNVPFIVEIEISSNTSGNAALFYLTKENIKYNKEFRINKRMKACRQTLHFEINDFDVRGKLRFDPINHPGRFTIHSIRLCIEE